MAGQEGKLAKELISLWNPPQPDTAQEHLSGSSPFDFPSEISIAYFISPQLMYVLWFIQKTKNNLNSLLCMQ